MMNTQQAFRGVFLFNTTERKRKLHSEEQDSDSKKVKTYSEESHLLDPQEYHNWTKEQVCSLLHTNEKNGGANLSIGDLKPLFKAGFKGASIANIIRNLETSDEKALRMLKTNFQDGGCVLSYELSNTLESVVGWVDKLFKTRLYKLWSTEHLMEQLCKPVSKGGPGLEEKDFEKLKLNTHSLESILDIIEFVKKDQVELATNFLVSCGIEDEKTCNRVIYWIATLANCITLHIIDFTSVEYQSSMIQTKLDEQFYTNPFDWIESFLNVNLKKCFLNMLDSKFAPGPNSIQGFYNREGFKLNVYQLVKTNITHFLFNKTNKAERKDSFRYGMISNGTGNGKTRACHEIQNIILDMNLSNLVDKRIRNLHTYFTLDNGNTLTSVESNYDFSSEKSEGKIIGLRVFANILGMNANNLAEKLGQLFKPIYVDTNFFTLGNISKKLSTFLSKEEILIWSITIDEIQNLYDIAKDKENWKVPLHAIGNFMVDTEFVNPNLEYNICFVPVISGHQYDKLRFTSTEYGNHMLSLPPLNPSNLNEILHNYFKNDTFSCKTPMIDMLKINNPKTINLMGIWLLEALVIPQVLSLTLQAIRDFFQGKSFVEWNNHSSTLFDNLNRSTESLVSQYLAKETLFNDSNFKKKLISRLLCSMEIELSEEEKQLFREGKIYHTQKGRIYIAPHYFQKVIREDSFIFGKLPQSKSDLNPRNFEKIDLQCFCYRMEFLKGKLVSVPELFPECTTGVDMSFQIPQEEFQIQDHSTFISKPENKLSNIRINTSSCIRQPQRFYSYISKTHMHVNAHFCLKNSVGEDCVFLLQYKNYDVHSSLDPNDWLNKYGFADVAVNEFTKINVKVYFVYITTTRVSAEKIADLQKHTLQQGNSYQS